MDEHRGGADPLQEIEATFEMSPSSILDQPAVLRVMFHPRRSWPGISLMSSVHDGRVEVEPGVSVGYSLHLAEPQSPLILYFHGNGEVARDYDSIAPLYTDLGISLLVADYRGYGWSDGFPTASSLVRDAPLVFEALGQIVQEAGSKVPQRVFVMGRSLGSAAAIEVARHHQKAIAGLIIESGFAHTARLLARLGVALENLDETQDVFANLAKIGQIRLPTLVIHGQADMLIPASEGVALYEGSAAPDDEKQLVVIPGAGHNNLLAVGADTYFEAIRDLVLG
jgi:alpha-beta hydrolase superfamily lysophospholipase